MSTIQQSREKDMSIERKISQLEKTPDPVVIWLGIGASVGSALGVIFHNLPMDIAMGVGLGIAIGSALSKSNKVTNHPPNEK